MPIRIAFAGHPHSIRNTKNFCKTSTFILLSTVINEKSPCNNKNKWGNMKSWSRWWHNLQYSIVYVTMPKDSIGDYLHNRKCSGSGLEKVSWLIRTIHASKKLGFISTDFSNEDLARMLHIPTQPNRTLVAMTRRIVWPQIRVEWSENFHILI